MQAIDVTWPPAEMTRAGPFTLRHGAGGGKRVSAASAASGATPDDAAIAKAEAAMRAWGQAPMFRLIPEDAALDAMLAARGCELIDPVALYAGPAAGLAGDAPHVASAYRAQFAPAAMHEIWDAGGIGPARRAVMERVAKPMSYLMTRASDRPCGAAFAAVDGDVAMIHAIEVRQSYRRQGKAALLIEAAARFALDHGAGWMTLAVTEANAPANALYAKLGMTITGRYHYRVAPDA